MKKINLFLFALHTMYLSCYSQDLNNVKANLVSGKIEEAKAEIYKLSSDPNSKENPAFWIWKSKVYAKIYKDNNLRAKYPGSETIASEAFTKYVALDPSMKLAKDFGVQDAAFDLYSTSFNQGIRTFNTKNWDSSLYFFKYSVEYSDVIFQNKWSTSAMAFDTTSILYAGYSAQNAKKMDEAYIYYSRLAANKVGGKTNIDIYRFILVTNSDRKDSAGFYKYYPIARQLYPNENWIEYEIDFIGKYYNLAGKTAFYDKEDVAGTLTSVKYLHFGDMFVNLSKEDKEGMDSAKIARYQAKGREAFKKAFYKDQTNAIAAYNAGVVYYNEFNIYNERVMKFYTLLKDFEKIKTVDAKVKNKLANLQSSYRQIVAPFKFVNSALVESGAIKNNDLNSYDQKITDAFNKVYQVNDKVIDKTNEFENKYKDFVNLFDKAFQAIHPQLRTITDSSINWLEKSYYILKDKNPKASFEISSYSKSIDFLSNLYSYKRDILKIENPQESDKMDTKFKFYNSQRVSIPN